MPRDLSAFFVPKSVAIIGASDTPNKIGAIILKNIIDSKFKGQIFPVNPNYQTVQNYKCYKNIAEIPEIPDLVVITIPAANNPQILDEIGQKGVKNVICVASGFKEIGEEGKKLEDELLAVAKKYNINLLGPNCLGFANNTCPINATFAEPVNIPGNLRLISQSGAIAASFLDGCKNINLGFSEIVSLGNKTDLNENDILEYFLSHPRPFGDIENLSPLYPIGLYLESISDGAKFLKLTKEISKNNPIFLLKPGKTESAKKAMQSHTGAIAGEDDILEEACREAGIIRCQTLEDFINLARAFSLENVPKGPRVVIISNAGGPSIIAADTIKEEGLELSKFDEKTKTQLKEILPSFANIRNPIDVLGDAPAKRFFKTSEIILQNNQADSLLVILTPQTMTEPEKTAEGLGELSKKYQKPIFSAFIGGSRIIEGEKILYNLKLPVFMFPERAIYALGKLWQWQKNQQFIKDEIFEEINFDLEKVKENLDNFQLDKLMLDIGIPTPSSVFAENLEEAENFAEKAGWPVVLKLSSPDLLHKKDTGGVITGIKNIDELKNSWELINQNLAALNLSIAPNVKIQVQKEIIGGIEIIVGIKKDPTFGPFLLFGAGGSLAEIIKDKNLHLLPVNASRIKDLIQESKIFPLLNGYRGEAPYDLTKLTDIILRLSKLAENPPAGGPQISDIEINPLILTHNNVWAVDVKIILSQENPTVNLCEATIINHQNLASTYHFFDFKTNKNFNFKRGQYISVKVAENNFNAYSIVRNNDKNIFSLLVDVKPNGIGSKYFENLKISDKLPFLGPFGNFAFNATDGAKKLIFLATGSGIAPIRSQIESALTEQKLQIPIILYWGLSYPYDVFWTDYFQKLSLDFPNFEYKIVVWKPDNSWQGYTGFITNCLQQDISDASNVSAYLCGNQSMIIDVTKILTDKGCPKTRIYTEKY